MANDLESLSSKEYPGRLIILGQDKSGKNEVVIYAITGRSPSSQARKLKHEGNAIWAKPTDEGILKRANRDLLLYPAILFYKGIAVSNGQQTEDIKLCLAESRDPVEVLASALAKWDYEPDYPAFTPRIGGCILAQRKAALGIIKRASDGSSERIVFEIPLKAGSGKWISTYEGNNENPLSPFRGEPIEVEIKENNPSNMAEAVYKALEPKAGKKDRRVAVACVFSPDLSQDKYEIFIINRHERTMK